MKLSAPLVTPASSSASTSRSAQSGARSEGLRTTALPAIRAGAVFHAGIAIGKVPGRDEPDHAERPAQGLDDDAVAFGGRELAAQPRAFPAVVAQDVDRAVDLAARLRQRLALLARHVAGDAVGPRLEDVGGAIEDLAALRRRDGRPRGLRLARRVDRLPRVGGVATRGSCRSPRRCRPGCASRTCGPDDAPTHAPADEVAKCLCHALHLRSTVRRAAVPPRRNGEVDCTRQSRSRRSRPPHHASGRPPCSHDAGQFRSAG